MRFALAVTAFILVAPPLVLEGQETRAITVHNRTDVDVWFWYQHPGEVRRLKVTRVQPRVRISWNRGLPLGVTWRLCAEAWVQDAEAYCRDYEGRTIQSMVRRDPIYFEVSDRVLNRRQTAGAALDERLRNAAARWYRACSPGDAYGQGARYRGLLKVIHDPDWDGQLTCFEKLTCDPAGSYKGEEYPQGFWTREGKTFYIWREMNDPDRRLRIPCPG